MSELLEEDDGGDIASGFGDGMVHGGEVSDHKAQQMLYGRHGEPEPDEGDSENPTE